MSISGDSITSDDIATLGEALDDIDLTLTLDDFGFDDKKNPGAKTTPIQPGSNQKKRQEGWAVANTAGDFKKKIMTKGESDFSGLVMDSADFSGATFVNANFKDTVFTGKTADFGNTMFNGETTFVGTRFTEDANFNQAKFEKEATFTGATFEKQAHFLGANFGDKSHFMNTTFKGDMSFQGTTFVEDATFNEARFSSKTNFTHVTFEEVMSFRKATFTGEAAFNVNSMAMQYSTTRNLRRGLYSWLLRSGMGVSWRRNLQKKRTSLEPHSRLGVLGMPCFRSRRRLRMLTLVLWIFPPHDYPTSCSVAASYRKLKVSSWQSTWGLGPCL
eukprot:m.106910 g.106910  ORF g.106910 m.106910 type:complete len:330 (+) comp21122_c0_seq2:513-1502(+)